VSVVSSNPLICTMRGTSDEDTERQRVRDLPHWQVVEPGSSTVPSSRATTDIELETQGAGRMKVPQCIGPWWASVSSVLHLCTGVMLTVAFKHLALSRSAHSGVSGRVIPICASVREFLDIVPHKGIFQTVFVRTVSDTKCLI
jgi:hypothetical protein